MVIYYLIFLNILIFSIVCRYYPEYTKVVYIGFAILLTCLAGFRGVGVSSDMNNYLYVFDNVYSYSDVTFWNMEPMAIWIPVFLKNLGIYGVTSIFFCFAALSVLPKIVGIYRISPLPLFSLLIFYSYLYFRQDFTQIRAGVAVGLFFLALDDIFQRKWLAYYLKIILAILFHNSAMVYLPLYFINARQINKKVYAGCVILLYILAAIKINLFTLIPGLSASSERLTNYTKFTEMGIVVADNILSYGNLINLGLVLVLIYYSELCYKKNKFAILCIKLYCVGLSLYALIGPLSVVVAGRVYEMFVGVLCIALLYLRDIFKNLFVADVVIIAYCMFFAYQVIINGNNVSAYFVSF